MLQPTMTELIKRTTLFLALLAISLITISAKTQQSATPLRLWSIGPLIETTPVNQVTFGPSGPELSQRPVNSQTGSIFAATRSIAFAGDRVVVAAQVGVRRVEGAQVPASVFKLFSLDVASGTVKNSREIVAFGSLKVFATKDGHILVCGRSVLRLTPDLDDAGIFDYEAQGHKFGRIQNVSPDGSTAGNATSPGFELVNLSTLEASTLTPEPAVDTSVNSKGFVTDNVHWLREYPKDIGFVTYTDATGDHLLYHGKCGGRPQFISDELILQPGCKNPLVINIKGDIVHTIDVRAPYSFAGTSQNGKRFALQIASSSRTRRQERFAIYSAETWQPVAEITPDEPSEEWGQSWTALSADGSMFVVGSPVRLVLYRLP